MGPSSLSNNNIWTIVLQAGLSTLRILKGDVLAHLFGNFFMTYFMIQGERDSEVSWAGRRSVVHFLRA